MLNNSKDYQINEFDAFYKVRVASQLNMHMYVGIAMDESSDESDILSATNHDDHHAMLDQGWLLSTVSIVSYHM